MAFIKANAILRSIATLVIAAITPKPVTVTRNPDRRGQQSALCGYKFSPRLR